MDEGFEGEVRLTMPASPPLLRVARLAAAGLAGRLGFTFDEIEDVKIAVDELCFVIVGNRGRDGDLSLVYRADGDALVIEGEGPAEGDGAVGGPSELSTQILQAVVDSHEISHDGACVRFRLRKKRGG